MKNISGMGHQFEGEGKIMRWSYKTVHYELKKEGLLGSAFLDESEIEMSLNEYGKAGWELVSLLETLDGLTAVFKQPLSLDTDSFRSARPGSSLPKKENPIVKHTAVKHKADTQQAVKAGVRSKGERLEEVVLWEEEGEELHSTNFKSEAKKKKKNPDVGSIRIE